MVLSESIKISKEFKEYLDKMKVHPRETYEECMKRLCKYRENKK